MDLALYNLQMLTCHKTQTTAPVDWAGVLVNLLFIMPFTPFSLYFLLFEFYFYLQNF